MSNKTKAEMVSYLGSVLAVLVANQDDFPALKGAIKAVEKAAEDPEATPPEREYKNKPVLLEVDGDTVLVKDTPFPRTRPGFLLKEALKKIGGKLSKAVNPETGKPYFKSVWDKKANAFRLPVEKVGEIRKAAQEIGLEIN